MKEYIKRLLGTAALCICTAAAVCGCSDSHDFDYDWTQSGLISHALGGIAGDTYTNSLEAFEYNYELGHRVFEVDFEFTSDMVLMCRHDFNRNNYETRGDLHFKDYELNSLPKTWPKVKAAEGAYTMLCFDDICRMIQKYPDIYIVTDTKYTDSEAVEAQFRYMVEHAGQADSDGDGSGILSHLIVQIYNRPMFQKIMDIYPFSSVIYTLYQSEDTDDQVVDFIKESGIRVVTTPAENFRADLAQRLN
jgi:glycerophosphoryl diester phosphodiesterase